MPINPHQIREICAVIHPYNSPEAVNAAYMDRCDLSAHGFYATPGIGPRWYPDGKSWD